MSGTSGALGTRMPSLERLISLLLSRELAAHGGLPELLPAESVRRIYGSVAIEAAVQQLDAMEALALLERYGLDREVLVRALQPAPVVAILRTAPSRTRSATST